MTNAGFSFMRGQIESLRSTLRALYASEGDITHAELGEVFGAGGHDAARGDCVRD